MAVYDWGLSGLSAFQVVWYWRQAGVGAAGKELLWPNRGRFRDVVSLRDGEFPFYPIITRPSRCLGSGSGVRFA